MAAELLSVSQCILALLFVFSAIAKLRAPHLFLRVAAQYALPAPLDRAYILRFIPALEMLVGLALLSGVHLLVQVGVMAALLFLALATAAIARRLARGESRFACGCSGNLDEETSAPWMLARNGVLIVLSFCLAFLDGARAPLMAADLFGALLTASAVVLGLHLIEATVRARDWIGEWTASG